ncbi:TPA: hypothetical protein ACH3X1_007849 [Trebouxia sp. C0004]
MVAWKKAIKVCGKHETPDSPRLHNQHKWGVNEQERWVRQDHTSVTPQSTVTKPSKSVDTQSETHPSRQDDWFSAALQQSAQLSDLVKQGKADEEQQADQAERSSRAKRPHKQKLRHKTEAEKSSLPQQDKDWFNKALQQSAQLESLQ